MLNADADHLKRTVVNVRRAKALGATEGNRDSQQALDEEDVETSDNMQRKTFDK